MDILTWNQIQNTRFSNAWTNNPTLSISNRTKQPIIGTAIIIRSRQRARMVLQLTNRQRGARHARASRAHQIMQRQIQMDAQTRYMFVL